jgi:hypothetical protein
VIPGRRVAALVALALLAGVPLAAQDAPAHAGAADASGPPGWLLGTDGKLHLGALHVGDGGIAIGGATVAIDQIAACDSGDIAPAIIDQGVVLADGALLRGVVRSLQAGKVAFVGDLCGAKDLPVAAVSTVVVTPASVSALAGIPVDFTGAILLNGDRVAGDPVFINAKSVGVDTHRRVQQLQRPRVLAVVLRAVAHGDQVRHWARLANGDRLDATGLAGKGLTLGTAANAAGITVSLPPGALRGLCADGGRFQSLLAVKSGATSGQQAFGEKAVPQPSPVPGAAPGSWPHAAGLRFEHAVTGPAGGEIAYDLAGKYATFLAVVAPADDSAGIPVCRVLVDGHQVFESGPLTSPQGIAVPIAGGHELRLVVANAAASVTDSGGAAATAVWGEPILAQ